jgi:hypothetical protein
MVAGLAALWIWAGAVSLGSLQIYFGDPAARDVGAFYRSAERWVRDGDLYDLQRDPNVNLNPPHVSVLLFTPLLAWDLPLAAVIWCGVQVLAAAAALACIRRQTAMRGTHFQAFIPAFLASGPVQHQLREGQVGGILLLVATLAWVSVRRGAGAWTWVAAGTSIKPWLGCWIPLLRRYGWTWALAAGAVAAAAGVALLGWEVWNDWSATVQSRPVRPNVVNLSLLGALARLQRRSLTDVDTVWPYDQPLWPVLALLVAGLTLRAWAGDIDRAWLAFGLAGILVSPFGWTYYVVVVTGPLLAWATRNDWPWPAVAAVMSLMATREWLQRLDVTSWAGGSLAFFGLVLLWFTALHWDTRKPETRNAGA